MGASKSFIKNAVGILIVVAICFVAVTIYKKGNASINSSLSDYDEIVAQFENAELKSYANSIVSGSQIIELIKRLEEKDELTIEVSNGYIIKNKTEAQKYTYSDICSVNSTVLSDIMDKANGSRYINPAALFDSALVYDENQEISSVVFRQR